MEDVAKRARREVEDHFQAIVEQSKAISGAHGALRKSRNDALAGMQRAVDNGINTTSTLAQRVKSAHHEYTEFSLEHGLVGRAADPQNTRVWWIIAISGVVELLINGWTLGTAHPSGFVGVLPEVLLFSTVNVVLGLLAGTARRRANYRSNSKVLFAWMMVVLCVVAVLLFTFVFGHYRDALVGLQSKIAGSDYDSYVRLWATLFRTALDTAFSANWIPQTMQTVVLIVAGWLISGIVAIEWYRGDDRYPGFGRITRKREQAQERYAEAVHAVGQQVHDHAQTASQELVSKATYSRPRNCQKLRCRVRLRTPL